MRRPRSKRRVGLVGRDVAHQRKSAQRQDVAGKQPAPDRVANIVEPDIGVRRAIGHEAGFDDQRQALVAAAVVGQARLVARLLERALEPLRLDPGFAAGLDRSDAQRGGKANRLPQDLLLGRCRAQFEPAALAGYRAG